MDVEKIKFLIRNIELLLDNLKTELMSNETYRISDISLIEEDYDEVFGE